MKFLIIAFALFGATTPISAALLPRPAIKSVWSQQYDAPWDSAPEQEAAGLTFQAVNDERELRVLVSALGRDGRNLIGGIFHQDLTIWFLKKDGKSRAWGLRLPFSMIEPGENFMLRADWRPGEDTPEPQVTPLRVVPTGSADASTAMPAGVRWRAHFSQRKPAFELNIPLSSLPSKFFDFTASRAPAVIEKRFIEISAPGRAKPYEREPPPDDSDVIGKIGPVKLRSMNYRRRGPSRGSDISPPIPRHLRFALRLAKPDI